MNRVVFELPRISLRRILSTCLVALIIFVSTTVGQISFIQTAQAATAAPQATDYQANRSNSDINIYSQPSENKAREAGGGLIESIKDTAETVKEKLNLDEPLPPSTKTFIKQLQGENVEAEEPIPFGKGQEPQNE